MAPRVKLDKAAWLWVETVKPEDIKQEHIELAYRINIPACKRGICRRNCKGNPNCLVGIGEQVWLGEIDENTFHNIDDPNSERREKNIFVGLTNLGATCYVNTFLQVWFHNLELRSSLYQCQNSRAQEHNVDSDYEPQSICEHLQYLFALLQNSNRKYIDPSGLVKALGLDTGQQQVNPLQTCSVRTRSLFKAFQIKSKIKIKEEKLDGENRYFCENCQSKQNATRRIRLHSLPPTLNLQLMRFVFDRQTGLKKKLNTFINFPEQLDMEPFLERKLGTDLLFLSRPSARSALVITEIEDEHPCELFSFCFLISPNLAETGKTQSRKPKCSKGYHCSRNAYMLVYKVQEEKSSEPSRTNVEVPAFLQKLVDQDNHKFEEWCMEMANMRKQSVDKGRAKHEEVKELYDLLPAKDGR
uniref:ubiquitinyl hydrolase 1 n=1 Tax=Cyprinodon variegatus TaxID=28743 RepID=A0A3Q2GK61_CYPVA